MEVNWTTLPEDAQASRELLKCGSAAREDAKASLQCLHFATVVNCVLIILFAYLIFNFCSLGPICVVASMLKIVPLHSPFIKM